jgi:hypothetical protein
MQLRRLRPTPATVLAALALFLALGGSAFAVGDHVLGSASVTTAQQRCATGAVKGIAVLGNPGVLPSQFTGVGPAFQRRFNCTGRGVQARKVATGIFDVRFPGFRVQTAIGGVLSLDGSSLSTVAQPDGSFRVTVRPSGTESNILRPTDLPFAVLVF